MLLRLKSRTTITQYDIKTGVSGDTIVFDFVNNIEIDTSFETLTDTAKITLPRKLTFKGKPITNGINAILKRGDKVKIELAYYPLDINKDVNSTLRTVFTGYISKVSINSPIIIECEDDMFLMKQTIVTYPVKYTTITRGKSGKKLKKPKVISADVTLTELLDNIIPDAVEYKALTEASLGMFRASKASVAEVLDKLRTSYGLYSYFVDGVLNIGLASDASRTDTIQFEFENNIIDDTNLDYRIDEDIRLLIHYESINSRTNERIEVEVGDADGARKDFKVLNSDHDTLQKLAEGKLKRLKYTGYKGRMEVFGEPYVRHGDAVKLISKKYPEKNGTYQVVSVERRFGMNGYRQFIELGIRLDSQSDN